MLPKTVNLYFLVCDASNAGLLAIEFAQWHLESLISRKASACTSSMAKAFMVLVGKSGNKMKCADYSRFILIRCDTSCRAHVLAVSNAVRHGQSRPRCKNHVFCSCLDSSQARQTVRWGLFRGLKCAPEKEAERAGRGAVCACRARVTVCRRAVAGHWACSGWGRCAGQTGLARRFGG